jgi:subtilisin family serine protease
MKLAPAGTSAVEPAQFGSGPMIRTPSNPGRALGPRLPPQSVPEGGGQGPGQPPRRPRGPRIPPIILLPDLPPGGVPPGGGEAQTVQRRRQQPAQAQLPGQRVERQILVLVDEIRPQALASQLAQAYGLELLSSRPIALLNARAELFRVRAGRSEAGALAALRRDSRIRSAQFNWRYRHGGEGSDGAASIPQYAPRALRLAEAHTLALGRNVPVAVIDSAVDAAHPDLEGAVVRTFDAVGGSDAKPDFHGTAVAGIIRSRGVVEGVAPQAEILAVRAFRTKPGAAPETTTEILLGAIDWAVSNGAKVLNMSFVGPKSGHLQELLEAASRKGVVLVAAAGNGGVKAPPAYPAAFPGVIAVTAVDASDRRYKLANRGRYIAVAAPGVDVLVPVDGGRHDLVSGTSFATAYVSGIAALLLERDPAMEPARVAGLIAAGADDIGPAGRDDDFGDGRVNAFAALQSVRTVAERRPE